MSKIFRIIIFVVGWLFILPVGNVFSHPAWGIVVDSRKQIYFSDLETVYKIDTQGKLSIFREGVSGRHVHDLSIDSQDNIYGLDNTYNPQTEKFPRSIWKMTPKGDFSYLVSLTNNLPLGRSIWQDSDGNTYSVEPYNNEKKETKIIKRTPDGKTSLFAGGKYGYLDGKKDKAEFSVITDMAFGKDNTIYLTNDGRVRKIDKSGTVSTVFRAEVPAQNQTNPEPFARLFGVAVDERNNVFTADFYNRRLLKISSDGKAVMLFNSEKDWSPIGVAATSGEVYVLEARPYSSAIHTGNRVLKISSDGKATIIANLEEANKSNNSPGSDKKNSRQQIEENKNSLSNSNTDLENQTAQAGNKKLGFYGIVGAVIVALTAFVFFKKNKFVS